MAQIAIHHNPFHLHRNVDLFQPRIGQTVRGWLDERGIAEFSKPTLCLVDGEPVLRKDWTLVVIAKDMVVSFITLPQGGGGGGKILRTVLTIAVMVAAPYAGAALAGTLGVTSAIGTSLLTAGIALAGSALLNALIPPPMPSSAISNYNATSPSPTYSLQAQGNQARLGEPIPVVYGRHVVYPDFGATPYSEFVNNDQFLFQLHVIGQGEYDIETIRIEDTPISSFEEIEYEIINPGGNVTLFDTDVVTAPEIAGQELLSTGDGGDWVGPFVANPSETQTTLLALDIILPKGLYYANDNGGLNNRTASWDIFQRFVHLRSITALVQELDQNHIRTKAYISKKGNQRGGRPIDKSFLYRFFRNRLYLGETTHKGKNYPGQHDAIITQDLWDAVHGILQENPTARANEARRKIPALLQGIMTCDCCGCALTPAWVKGKRGQIYRYYVPTTDIKRHYGACTVGPIPAGEIEALVTTHARKLLFSPEALYETWKRIKQRTGEDMEDNEIRTKLKRFDDMWESLFPAEQQRILRMLVHAIHVSTERVHITLRLEGIYSLIQHVDHNHLQIEEKNA